MAESEEELKSLLMRVKEESEKSRLKLSIVKTKMMASGPIISWQIDGEKWKQWQILFSWAPKSLWMVSAAMKFKKIKSVTVSIFCSSICKEVMGPDAMILVFISSVEF